jgi:two-component system, OmpR family, KDP operon response regulator KdpE
MSYEPLVMIVEDDRSIRHFLRTTLRSQGYRLLEVTSGKEAISLAASHVPDLVILDLGLPDIDGMEVLSNFRSWSSVPVIVVSARGKERAKIEALDAGADDYLTKPFGVGELLARIRVAFRHRAVLNGDDVGDTVFELPGLRVDLALREVTVDGDVAHLTPTEFRLLVLLIRHAGKILTHRFLLSEVWGPGNSENTQYLRVFMAHLRRKIERDPANPRYLITEIGVGYRLRDE